MIYGELQASDSPNKIVNGIMIKLLSDDNFDVVLFLKKVYLNKQLRITFSIYKYLSFILYTQYILLH